MLPSLPPYLCLRQPGRGEDRDRDRKIEIQIEIQTEVIENIPGIAHGKERHLCCQFLVGS